jgi:tetratricopeptide (TPR) repeat protein
MRPLLLSLPLFSLLWTPNSAFRTAPRVQRGRILPFPTVGVSGQAPSTALFYREEGELSTEDARQRLPVALHRQLWLDKSLSYYTKVMREERRRSSGQAVNYDTTAYQDSFTTLAKKHYFALRKIKSGKWQHAETIYRRIISELVQDDECDHAQLAVTTLLLALLLQRMGLRKETRSVFLHFFRVAVLDQDEHEECACSAKVLQAYALFEMKQGNSIKSLELVKRAVQLDPALEPVLNWKQFRDVLERKSR